MDFESIEYANFSTRAGAEKGSGSAVQSGSRLRPRACPGWLERLPYRPRDRDPPANHIASHARGVYRLRIWCANAYPELIKRCEDAMGDIIATKVSRVACVGCTEVASFSKHWPCLFPQHGPGRKHERRIELVPWRQELVDLDPRPLVGGLLHSDGCRVLNLGERNALPALPLHQHVGRHPRIFGRACDQLGIEWRPNNRWSLSVARRGASPCWTSSWSPSDELGRRTNHPRPSWPVHRGAGPGG
jgi:hypothetical protein